MSLIGSTPLVPTTEVIQAQLVLQLQAQMNLSFQRLSRDFTNMFSQVWANNDGLTPQQVMDAFGANASQLFLLAGATETYLNTIVPGTITQSPPYAFTINQDGTVTIGAAI